MSSWDFPVDGSNMFDHEDLTTLNDFFTNWDDSGPSSEKIIEEFPISKPVPPRLPAPIITERLHLVNSQFVQNFNLKKENILSAGSDQLSANPNVFSASSLKPLTMYTSHDSGPQSAKSTPNTPTPPLSDSGAVNGISFAVGSGVGFGPGSGSGGGRKRAAKMKKEPAAKKLKASLNNDPSQAGKGLLTEEEKKHNHVVSEQRRRQAIRDGFDEIVKLTPALINGPVSAGPGNTGGGHSKSTILNAAAAYILELQEEVMKLKKENFALRTDRNYVENVKINNNQAIPSFEKSSSMFQTTNQHYVNSPSTIYPQHGASFFEESQDQYRGRYGEVAPTSANK